MVFFNIFRHPREPILAASGNCSKNVLEQRPIGRSWARKQQDFPPSKYIDKKKNQGKKRSSKIHVHASVETNNALTTAQLLTQNGEVCSGTNQLWSSTPARKEVG